MKITVTMTAEEYDLYRAYQKDKETLEQEVNRPLKTLREDHENLCAAVMSALEVDESTLYAGDVIVESSIVVTVKDHTAAASAIDLAADWYA